MTQTQKAKLKVIFVLAFIWYDLIRCKNFSSLICHFFNFWIMLFVSLRESNYSHTIMWLHYDFHLHQQGSDTFPVTHQTAENIMVSPSKTLKNTNLCFQW